MGTRYDLTGEVFGRLKVLGFDHISNDGASYWLCECSCKNRTRLVVRGYNLKVGKTLSCGCLRRESNDITGQRYGRLIVLGLDYVDAEYRTYWLCECDCGNRVTIRKDELTGGHTISCGCYNREELVKRFTKHGMSGSRLYKIWVGMIQRCENENNPRYWSYGERSISVCDEWHDFENFYNWSKNNGYSDDLTIDRIDNSLGYYPENCRWADRVTQQNNRKNSHYFTYAGITKTITEWSRYLGVSYSTLWYRIERGDFSDFEEYFSRKQED